MGKYPQAPGCESPWETVPGREYRQRGQTEVRGGGGVQIVVYPMRDWRRIPGGLMEVLVYEAGELGRACGVYLFVDVLLFI